MVNVDDLDLDDLDGRTENLDRNDPPGEGRISPIPALLFGLPFACLLVLFSGCSSFERDWEAFPNRGDTLLEGRWEGSWRSEHNGHEGGLRCMISRGEGEEYPARFKATYGKIFRFGYSMVFHAEKKGDRWEFRGEEDLGWLAGGVYRYHGWATDSQLEARYEARKDHGVYQMTRVEAPLQP